MNAPRSDSTSEDRMENSVFTAATNIIPTAMGRTTLYQSV